MPHQYGRIDLSGGRVFHWTIDTNAREPEVYGWVEKDNAIVKGTNGWWRTDNPARAAVLADLMMQVKARGEERAAKVTL
jgi:hypothetical protein